MVRQEVSEKDIVSRRTTYLLVALETLNYILLVGLGTALWYGVALFVEATHVPVSASKAQRLAVVAFLAPNVIGFARGLRRGHVVGNSIQLSERQIPAIHSILARHAERLAMPVPELFLSETALKVNAEAFSAFRSDYILLSPHFLERKPKKSRAVISFMLGREIGRIRLGYTSVRHDVGFFYVKRIPLLRNVLFHAKTRAADRFGAWLEPDGLEGLMVVASGRRMLQSVGWKEFVREVERRPGIWTRFANVLSPTPSLADRARRLLRTGLLVLPMPEVEQGDDVA